MLESVKKLPAKANLRHLKIQARDLLQELQQGDRQAAKRFKNRLPKYSLVSQQEIVDSGSCRQDAQLVIAREYGFKTWAELKEYVELQAEQRNRTDKLNPEYLRKVQYHDDSNLNPRIEIHSRFTPPEFNMWHILWNYLDLKNGYKVLDAGCGNGRFWGSVWADIPPNVSLTLLDTSPGLLEIANNNLKDTSLNYDTVKGCLGSLEFADESFDVVSCQYVMHLVENVQSAVRDLHRTLKSGGYAVIACIEKRNMGRIAQVADRVYPKLGMEDYFASLSVADEVVEEAKSIFSNVVVEDYDCMMKVDDLDILLDYTRSLERVQTLDLPPNFWEDFERLVQDEIEEKGYFSIRKHAKTLKCFK